MTQQQFAENIGVKRNTVSQYETGLAIPSAEVLMRILNVASQTDEKEFILSRIAALASGFPSWKIAEELPSPLDASSKVAPTLTAQMLSRLRELPKKVVPATERRLVNETAGLLADDDVDPVLPEMIHLYRSMSGNKKARRKAFRQALNYLRVQLAESSDHGGSETPDHGAKSV